MNIVSRVTWRYMKKNKKRTLVTIFGVIISVAMVTAVLISIASFMELFQREEITNYGSWMAEYAGIDKEQAAMLAEEGNISQIMLRGELGYCLLPEENVNASDKPYLYVEGADPAAMEDMRLTVSQGRLPQNPGEIVISSQLLSDMGDIYQIGDTITLEFGHREWVEDGQITIVGQDRSYRERYSEVQENFVSDHRTGTYTIVGFTNVRSEEYSWAPGYSAITFLDMEQWPKEQLLTARVTFRQVTDDIYEKAAAIDERIGSENFRMHDGLLRYYGVTPSDYMNAFIKSIAGFLILLIVVGSVLLIYNAFAISLSERSRQLGMLSSVGATKAQKRWSVFFEGAVIGGISIPLGLLTGIGGMAVTFRLISPFISRMLSTELDIHCVVRLSSVVAAVCLAALTIFVSAWIPAVRASRITPVDSIRRNRDIKLTRRQVKTSRLTRFLFHFEGDLAQKNMKRNKKSYRITIVSLVVSFTLFLGVSGYTSMLQRAMNLSDNTSTYDVYVTFNPDNREALSMCTSLDTVDEYNIIIRNYISLYFNEEDSRKVITPDYRTQAESYNRDEYGVQFIGMPREQLGKYIAAAGLDESLLDTFDTQIANGQLPVIFVNRYNVVTDSYQWADMIVADLSEGDQYNMDLFADDVDGNRRVVEDFENMSVLGVTSQMPMGLPSRFYPYTDLYAITLDTCVTDMYARALEFMESSQPQEYYVSGSSMGFLYMSSSDPETLSRDVSEIMENNRGDFIDYYSAWETDQSDRSLILVMQVFCYGFIALMTLICTANIINTISTSIDLRRREFAMLKSVGMDPGAFNRMLVFESLFYGIKTLLYGIPLSVLLILMEYNMMQGTFDFPFFLPIPYYIAAIIVLIGVVGIAMAYSFSKIRRENILEGLRTE